jgi:hypothetical protein
MNLILSLVVFILFWWALLATIFSFQLHKQNEDYARRLGVRLPSPKVTKPDFVKQIRNSIPFPANIEAIKFILSHVNLSKIIRFIPAKIGLK